MLHQHHSHREAAARIAWCINNRAIGVVTGEVGSGKTVAFKGAVASLDPARFAVIYQPNARPTGQPLRTIATLSPDRHRGENARIEGVRGRDLVPLQAALQRLGIPTSVHGEALLVDGGGRW
ncbi:hypothetical protein ACFYP6_33870 [Streptomyces goshikiensis]|uniref:hypothetical protein n=1 Tax=Streptomyces goshikiensis TaxID=1942 RepID=UPI0036A002DA